VGGCGFKGTAGVQSDIRVQRFRQAVRHPLKGKKLQMQATHKKNHEKRSTKRNCMNWKLVFITVEADLKDVEQK
jgi:hypothetical protein